MVWSAFMDVTIWRSVVPLKLNVNAEPCSTTDQTLTVAGSHGRRHSADMSRLTKQREDAQLSGLL